jgi:hypothetical protein
MSLDVGHTSCTAKPGFIDGLPCKLCFSALIFRRSYLNGTLLVLRKEARTRASNGSFTFGLGPPAHEGVIHNKLKV